MIGVHYLKKMVGIMRLVKAFRNHPCTKCRRKPFQYCVGWIAHGIALCTEYRHRYGSVHPCNDTLFEPEEIVSSQIKKWATCHTLAKDFAILLQCPMSLNMTQALTLLLLTKCTLSQNLGLHLIIFVTHPENQIGFDL